MPYAQAEGARLWYEEAGSGHPILFIHEFGADHREWEDQVRFFSREYRCITYAARGYPPSEVPESPKLYGQDFAVADAAAVLRHLGIPRAHVVGLSMGGFAALLFGIRHPEMAVSLVPAGAGSGSPRADLAEFRSQCAARGDRLIAEGWPGAMAEETGHAPTRIQLKKKDPRGWAAYMARLAEHSGLGTGLTMKHYQGERDSILDWEAELRRMEVPTLLAVGDEDWPCIETNIFLKKVLPNAGLWMCPRTGHAINLEEPAAFNAELARFFSTVERGRWRLG
ncbi:alpha/beta fold hydrolase [Belnapia rosea]|uniref:Pimeloyl-ACP methyl ester carboxylesterase n=1 Tax=Belnapia rosea TaxID=938405 RepID=A0A1G6WZ67_9PROT|nr:alpha/beta hydrolase [Belnapia rosea]SDB68200.1 Pimeloyl-ACP methyl ester carboxylesterase [Belnapia rosea]SDD70295.1 Pimeloyl-ACP methyl ester carboxylesterase [Belnapia rosea]